MRSQETLFDPKSPEPSFDFVFRDFERSKIQRLRGILAEDHGLFSLIYFIIAVFWTTMMSLGAVSHGNGSFALNLAPHVAFYTLIIGYMLYPRNKLWVPISAFTAVFLLPFVVHSASGERWIDLALNNPLLVLTIYLGHIVSGLGMGALSIHLANRIQNFSSRYSVDLLTVIVLSVVFILVCFVQNWVIWQVVIQLPSAERLALGFDADFVAASVERVLRGTVVASGFLMGVLEVPDRRSLLRGMAVSTIFMGLAGAQELGFGFHPALDASLLALLVIVLLPTPIGISACIIGIPVYSALTGTFLSTAHLHDPSAAAIERFAIGLLMLIALIPTLRIPLQHSLRMREASLRRFSMVRDFANVGLLSFNLDRQIFRTDVSAQRLLDTPALGDIGEFVALFAQDTHKALLAALSFGNRYSVNLLLHRHINQSRNPKIPIKEQVLRMFLWYERAPSGESVAYGLVLDVTGEHDQERALQDTLAELSLRQERQRQLFSIVSHELRTPAAVISMLVDDLDESRIDAKSAKLLHEATDQLMVTLGDMRQTVNPTQNLPVTRDAYCPADLADSLRNMFEPKARDNGMTIRLRLSDQARASRFGDHRRVRQALANLLRNAILHSRGKEIVLAFDGAFSPNGAPLSRWTVSDNGRGIPADQVERLFEPFERGLQDPRSHVDGSGLGLYIVKSSIETLGGSIAHFAPPKGGTGFVIELPEAMSTAAMPKPRRPKKAKAQEFFDGVHVLLAEDNALVAEVTMAKLARIVGRVDLAVNGRCALEQCRRQRPDILITDLFMPEMDGDRLIEQLRADAMDFPIVGLTAAAVGDDIERLTAAGASAVMVKPLEIDSLLALIRNVAAQKQSALGQSAAQRRSA